MKTKLFFLILLLPFFISCTIAQVKYTALSVDPQVAQNLQAKSETKHRIEGADCTHMILFIPLGWPKEPQEFVTDTLKQTPSANTLADANIRVTQLFTFFYNRVCQYIDGVPVKL